MNTVQPHSKLPLGIYLGKLQPSLQILDYGESDKHSSLLRSRIDYGRKNWSIGAYP